MKIKDAFEKHSVPVKAYPKPGEFIAQRHAMKDYLGRDSGLAAVIRAVVDGSLVPVGYTNRFRGVTGYLFLRKEVAAQIQMPSRRMLREAALRRIVAARKKQWVAYRQAREIALARPMRRQRR